VYGSILNSFGKEAQPKNKEEGFAKELMFSENWS
jgi:hypothetical protein